MQAPTLEPALEIQHETQPTKQQTRQDKLARRKAKHAQAAAPPTPIMPHAENTDMPPTTNGVHETPKSAFLSHLSSYPLITHLTSHPLAQKSLSLTTSTLTRLSPLLQPLAAPYAALAPHLAPYLQRADALGDSALARVDGLARAPKDLYNDSWEWCAAAAPLQRGVDAKEHVLRTYGEELKRSGGEPVGVVTYGRAAVATGLVVGGEAVAWAREWRAGPAKQGEKGGMQ